MRATEGDLLEYRVVDAFTQRPFAGNPAAVILPGAASDGLDDGQRQWLAAEMNLSETAFPSPVDDSGTRRLRWFTPSTEVTLCGHATLATAHALLEEGAEAPFRFFSTSGPLTVEQEGGGRLRLDFPADPPEPLPAPEGLMQALGLPPDTSFLSGSRCALVPLDQEAAVLAVEPDQGALGRVALPPGVMGISVTAPGSEAEVDFVSRFFGPWVGVPEDPVTGMAHTVLGPYWAEELGRDKLEARQRSRRGGQLGVRVRGNRVHLTGTAITVARGRIRVPPATPPR